MAADEGIGSFLIEYTRRYDRGVPEALKTIVGEAVTRILGAFQPMAAQVTLTAERQNEANRLIGILMAKIDELGQKIDANTAQANKALAEIRQALDKALEAQITPEELAAAVADAKASQKLEDEAAFDAALAPLTEKLAAQSEALQKLDDVVPDAPVEPAPAEPTEPTPGEPVPTV